MTEHDHDEIARRLRDSGTVPAPERLQGEVMDQVRAEPRLRRSRRSFLAPAIPYAAAAAVLAALVLGLSHLGGGSGGSASSAEGGGASGGATSRSPAVTQPSKDSAGAEALDIFRIPSAALQNAALAPYVKAHASAAPTVVLAVPSARFHEFRQRLSAIQERTRGDDTIRVILRPAR
jgi:negative regulator of sigma E activity